MSKSTRSAGSARGRFAGFEYFDRRQDGPWNVLRVLFRTWRRVLFVVAVAAVLTIALHWNPYVVLGVLAVLFVASFAIVWKLVGLVIRARAILTVLAGVYVTDWWLKSLFGDITGNLMLVALVVGLCVFPPTGRFLLRRAWCVLDRHRIRSCLKVCKIRTMNLDGSLPFLLWAHPTKTGERIWVWVRAGASGDDIESALSYIAPACFARDARLHSVRKLATLVAVEIIRRDPLSTGQAIPSPLSRLVSLVKGDVTGEGTGTITPVTVADITATEVSPVPEGSTVRKNGHKTTTKPVESVDKTDSFVVAGEDLTDYIN